jgi:RNA polymerase sigma-70 factor (ECF subfamily)
MSGGGSETAAHMHVVRAAAGGDEAALTHLVKQYHERVYRYGERVCRDGFDADDAVQEAFVKLARRPDVARDRGVFFWLTAVVKNACLRMLRPFARQRRTLGDAVEADEVECDGPDPHAALEKFELVRQVHAALAALPEPYREVLVLRDLEGLSGDETARALGLELAAMKSRLCRARSMLRNQLQPNEARARE